MVYDHPHGVLGVRWDKDATPLHNVGMLHGASDGVEIRQATRRRGQGERIKMVAIEAGAGSGADGSGRRPRYICKPHQGGRDAALAGSGENPLGIFVDEAAEERV